MVPFGLALAGLYAWAAPSALRLSRPTVPLYFDVSQGQVAEHVDFISRGKGYTLALSGAETLLTLRQSASPPPPLPDSQCDSSASVLRMAQSQEHEGHRAVVRKQEPVHPADFDGTTPKSTPPERLPLNHGQSSALFLNLPPHVSAAHRRRASCKSRVSNPQISKKTTSDRLIPSLVVVVAAVLPAWPAQRRGRVAARQSHPDDGRQFGHQQEALRA